MLGRSVSTVLRGASWAARSGCAIAPTAPRTPFATNASSPAPSASASGSDNSEPKPAAAGPAPYNPHGINHDDIFFPAEETADRKTPEYIATAMKHSEGLSPAIHTAAKIVSTSDVALGFSAGTKKPVRGTMTEDERAKWASIIDRARSASERGNRAALQAIYEEAGVPPVAPDGTAAASAMDRENAGRAPMPRGFSMQTPVDPTEGIPEAFLTRELRDLAPLYKIINEQWNRSSPAAQAPRVSSGRLSQVDLWTALVHLQDGSLSPQAVLDRYRVRLATMGHSRGPEDEGRLDDSAAALADFEAFSQSMEADDMSPFYHQPADYHPPRSTLEPGPKTVAEAEELERQQLAAAAAAATAAAENKDQTDTANTTTAVATGDAANTPQTAEGGFGPRSALTAAQREQNLADEAYRAQFSARIEEFYATRLSVFDRLRFLRLVDIFSVHHPALGRLMRGERVDDDTHALERGLLRVIFHLVRAKELTEAELDFFSGTMRRLMNHAAPGSSMPLGDRVFFANEGAPLSDLSRQHQERLRRFGVPEYARSSAGVAPLPTVIRNPGRDRDAADAQARAAGRALPGSPYALATGTDVTPTPFLVRSLYAGALSAPLVQAASKDDPAVAASFAAFPAEVMEMTAKYLRVPWLVESVVEVQGTVRTLHAVINPEQVPRERRGRVERLNFGNIIRTADSADTNVVGSSQSVEAGTGANIRAPKRTDDNTVHALKDKFKLEFQRAASETMAQVGAWTAPATERARELEDKVWQQIQRHGRGGNAAADAATAAGEEIKERPEYVRAVDDAEAEMLQQPDLFGGPRAVKLYLEKLDQLQRDRDLADKQARERDGK